MALIERRERRIIIGEKVREGGVLTGHLADSHTMAMTMVQVWIQFAMWTHIIGNRMGWSVI